ncbi:hypothetical protein A3Q56_06848 [Intoshia linei]|uniref:Uncharacterized protein n=1 Tax=Intoshia linei TaxID=1819745 RepID=A0A177ATU9_9BILA|nr:hypothetical protein A3Q56_06848 [Intoshia linei]
MWKVLFKINFVRNKTPSESNEKSESLVEEKEKEVNCNEDTENLIEIGEVYQIHQVELKNKTKKIVNQLELSDLVNTRQGIFGGLETNLNAIEADTLFLCKNVDLAAFRLYIDEKLIKTTNVSVNVIKARHVYSLDALSYIQSGKKNSTIYQSYSPNCKFSVIVEKCNNVYIYLKESSQLNKKTIHKNPKIVDTIAKQYIFTLADKFDDIVGIKIINDHQIHLLTQLSIIVLYIKI